MSSSWACCGKSSGGHRVIVRGSSWVGALSRPIERVARISDSVAGMPAVLISCGVVLVGSLFAVVLFSVDWGEFRWMQRAFDEPYYFWRLAHDEVVPGNRLFSKLFGLGLLAAGVPFDWMTEAYALVMPLAEFLGAYLLAGLWQRRPLRRTVWALVLLMAFDLLSGSSFVLTYVPPVDTLSALLGRPELLKTDWMNFFIFNRRPEQQSSFVFLFPYFAGVLASFLTWRPRLYLAVCAVTPLLALIYIHVAVIALIVFVLLSLIAGTVYRRPIWLCFAISIAATAAAFAAVFTQPATSGDVAVSVFRTHLPFLRPSLAMSLVGLAILAFVSRRSEWPWSPQHWAAAAFFAVPVATLCQQIVTGRAVLPQNWEISGNYICVAIGGAMLLHRSALNAGGIERPAAKAGALCLWLLLLVVIVRGELRNEVQYRQANDLSIAYGKVYEAALVKAGPVDGVILPHLWDESLFVTRVPAGARVLGGFNGLLKSWPPAWEATDSFEQHAARAHGQFEVGFEILARLGLTPEKFMASLKTEIAAGGCWPTLMYFFATQDCWGAFSNYTSPALGRLPSVVAPLTAMYESYLRDRARDQAGRKVLLITQDRLAGPDQDGRFGNRLVASFETSFAGRPVRAYAYLQGRAAD